VTSYVAPPYDVIDPAMRAELEERDPTNVVRLTLPETTPGGGLYRKAARLLGEWMKSGVLYRENIPAMYVWEQEFSHGGATHKRRALVAKVTCETYRPGGVMRHEHTHTGPKEDRLNLFRATGAQFSQIFGIFDDEENKVSELLSELADGIFMQSAKGDDGHISRLLGTTDTKLIESLQAALQARTIIIADGHHRYETSVAYYEGQDRTGSTLMTLVPSSDPGLVVLPTHRTVGLPLDSQAFMGALESRFSMGIHEHGSWSQLYQEAVDRPDRGIILALTPDAQVIRIGWGQEDIPDSGQGSLQFQISDTVVLHEEILPLVSDSDQIATEHFGYHHDAEEAVDAAQKAGQWCFLLRATSVETLLSVTEQQRVLPPKSTYFYPKFLAGFVSAYLD
jgi:uncharacterized protein (DUF1015 family)